MLQSASEEGIGWIESNGFPWTDLVCLTSAAMGALMEKAQFPFVTNCDLGTVSRTVSVNLSGMEGT